MPCLVPSCRKPTPELEDLLCDGCWAFFPKQRRLRYNELRYRVKKLGQKRFEEEYWDEQDSIVYESLVRVNRESNAVT